MAGRIQQELRQTRPIRLIEEEAVLNVIRTAEVLTQRLADVLKPYDVSPTQYNVLRILRGAGAEGATCKDISARLITRDPDITRLLDRMHARSLVTRDRAAEDRRFVTVKLTKAGLDLVNRLDRPIEQVQRDALKHMSAAKIRHAVDLLEEMRAT